MKRYSLEGVKIAEENYRWGKLHGKQQYFTYNGGLEREESWRAIDPAMHMIQYLYLTSRSI
ncbi:MAG: hypothetical protein IPL04_06880 [Chitinophagaceae bacterium]|nr:hypothetical protein [Chitinophagaceae bacterium]